MNNMKKIFAVIASCAVLAGCGSEEKDVQNSDQTPDAEQTVQNIETESEIEETEDVTDEHEVTEQEESEEPPEEIQEAEGLEEPEEMIEDVQNVHFARVGEESSYDLDGDGEDDKVSVTVADDEKNSVLVYINGVCHEDIYHYTGTYLSNYYGIVDVDTSDGTLQLCIQDYGPSGDFESTIYSYDGTELIKNGTITGIFENGFGSSTAVCNGDGTISSYLRLDVFQTWYGKITYKLEDNKIVLVEQDLYEPSVNSEHKLLVDLTVYADRDLNSEATVLAAETVVKITATDNKQWIRLEVQMPASQEDSDAAKAPQEPTVFWARLDTDKLRRIETENDYYLLEWDLFGTGGNEVELNSVYKLCYDANVYLQPSFDGEKETLSADSEVTVLEYIGDEWIKVKKNSDAAIVYMPLAEVKWFGLLVMVDAETVMSSTEVFDGVVIAG